MTNFMLQGMNKVLPQPIQYQVAKAVSIFETNAFKLETSTKSGMSGVFATRSSNTGFLTVHAIRDVEVHEEITIPYVSLWSDRR